MKDIYFWRQFFIVFTIMVNNISIGMMIAFPSILTPALLANNTTGIHTTKSEVSWITTSNGISGVVGFFVLSPVLQTFGRKIVFILDNIFLLIGWIIFSLAESAYAILIARIVQGIALGCLFVQGIIVSEYCHPKRRGYFMPMKKTFVALGVVICHVLAVPWNWQQVATFGIAMSALSMIMVFFWPESPSYLAMKGRFKESEESFIWLHGTSNMKELQLLHSSRLWIKINSSDDKWYMRLFKKEFMKPFLVVVLSTIVEEFSGNHYFSVYLIKMMTTLLEVKSLAAYLYIGADIVRIAALIISCFVLLYFKRRTILYAFGIPTVAVMFAICGVVSLDLFASWSAPLLIITHGFLANIGIIAVSFTIFGEIFPLDYKGWGSCLNGVIFTLLYTLLLKITPILLDSIGVGYMYFIYGIVVSISLVVLYYLVPETKDIYLQEIENNLKGVNSDEVMLATEKQEN